jgi:GAF domain-containing protein
MDEVERWEALLRSASPERDAQPGRICELCVETLDVSGAGITMVTATGNRGVVCATDDRAARIEDLQITVGAGPCVDAVASGGPVLLPDLDNTEDVDLARWAGFAADIRRDGVRAIFAFPLQIGAVTLGALDLHRDRPGVLTDRQLAGALLAADAAAMALLHLNTDQGDAFARDTATGTDYRLEIHQATGMVAEQLGIKLDNAMLRLRARAFADGRSLAAISADVVARRLRFTSEDL